MTPIEACLANRGPPLPWVAELAAAVEGESTAAFRTDAGARSRSLSTAATLFGLPAVPAAFDVVLGVEALGCEIDGREDGPIPSVRGVVGSVEDAMAIDVETATRGGRVPAVLEAMDRLAGTLEDTSVLAGIADPTLAAEFLLTDAGRSDPDAVEEAGFLAEDLAVELANASLSRGADGVVVLSPAPPSAPARFDAAVRPLLNVVDHFDGVAIQARPSLDDAAIDRAASAGFDAVTGSVTDPRGAVETAEDAGIVIGIGVRTERFLDGTVGESLDGLPARSLASSEWAVPAETAPEAVNRLMRH